MVDLQGSETTEFEQRIDVRYRKAGNDVVGRLTFYMTFERPPRSDFLANAKAAANQLRGTEEIDEELDVSADYLVRHTRGWRDLVDRNNEKVEFNEQNLRQVLDHPDYWRPIERAFTALCTGEGARKNS